MAIRGGRSPPPDFGEKSWQVVDFCWQVLRNLKKLAGFKILHDFVEKSWQVVDFLLAGFEKFEKLAGFKFSMSGSLQFRKI